jgi:hypothetical protein
MSRQRISGTIPMPSSELAAGENPPGVAPAMGQPRLANPPMPTAPGMRPQGPNVGPRRLGPPGGIPRPATPRFGRRGGR